MARSIPTIEGLEARVLLSGSPIVVDTFGDVVDEFDGYTSLREAITLAAAVDSGDDVIHLPTGNYALTNGQLTINDTSGNLSILGLDGLATLDAQGDSRVLEILTGSNVQLTQLGITGGYSSGSGGGMYTAGNLTLDGCDVYGNQAYYAGGIYADYSSTLNVINSAVSGNTAAEYGFGGISASGGTLNLNNTTVAGNYGGGVQSSSPLNLNNTIVAMNDGGEDVSGEWTGSNNLVDVDPQFVRNPSAGVDEIWGTEDDDYGDLRLTTYSQAINAGDNALAVNAEGEPLTTDLDGNARIYDSLVDIGAYEAQDFTRPVVAATLPQAGNEYTVGDPNGYAPGQITVEFNTPMNPDAAANSANYDLRRDTDNDGDFTDETPMEISVSVIDNQIVHINTGGDLPTGEYQLTINSQAEGLYGINGMALDGDADGLPGGDWVGTFTMLPRPKIDGEYGVADDVHSLAIPRIDLGTTAVEWFSICNEGDAPLVLGSISFGGDGTSFTVTNEFGDPLPATITLAPGVATQIQIHYTPTEQGRDFDTLYIYSNDADEPIYEVAVTGEAVLPQGVGYYEVWGGTTDYRDGDDDMWWQPYYNIDQQDYVYLGGGLDAWGATEFLGGGDYDYYVIAARARVQIDSVEGGDSEYAYSSGDGNTYDWDNLYGPPDESFVTVGYQGNSDSFCGFMILENPGEWNGMTVYTGNIDLPLHVNIEQSGYSDGTGKVYLYEHGVDVYDQGWSTSMRFQAPSGQWYDLWWDVYDAGNYGWEYSDESFTNVADLVSEFGEGWYTIEASGSPFGAVTTQVWFGDEDGETPLAWPTQIPEITSIAPGQADVPTTATLEWSPVTDPNVTNIHADVEDAYENDVAWFWTESVDTTSSGSVELDPANNYSWDLDFQNHNSGITNDGFGYHVGRSLSTSVLFRTEGEPSDVQPNLVMGEAFYTPGIYRPGDAIGMDFLLGNLGDGNAVAVGEDGLVDLFYSEVRLSLDTTWGNNDDVVIYRRGDYGWLGQEALDTRQDVMPHELWPGGLPVIPLDIERGNYYVLAGIDVQNQVAESNEGDNLWISATANISVETRVENTQAIHVLCVGVANPLVGFRGDVAAKRVHEAFEGMEGLVSNILVRYNIDAVGNQQHLLETLAWFESRVLPGDQFILYVASQACYDLHGNEIAVDAQFNTAKGQWNLTQTTTGDEYLYLSSVDGASNWMSDDKLAASFFTYNWAAANKAFLLDTPYAGGFIGRENPDDPSQWDLSLLRFDPSEVPVVGQTHRTQWATGTVQIIAAAGEGQFAFMTPEKIIGWNGVNRMGTHMIAPILAQAGPGQNGFDIEQLFWQTQEVNSVYCNDVGMLFAYAEGNPNAGDDDGFVGGGGTVIDLITGGVHVQLGADVKVVCYVDADGSLVTLQLNRGVADLTFLGENLRQTFAGGVVTVRADGGALLGAIRLIDTTANDTLSISVRGGNGFAEIGGINGGGSLAQLLATKVDLVGDGILLEGGAFIGLTRLNNIRNGADVRMSGVGPAKGVQFFASSVGAGADLHFGGAIFSLSLTRWVGGSLKAAYIQSLRVQKDMGADVTLTGANGLGQSIVGAYVFGNVTGGDWNVAGAVRNWYVQGGVFNAGLQLNGLIANLYVGGNLLGSEVNLDDAKMIRVGGRVDDSRVTSRGDINAMIVGAMRNSTVFAGVRADYSLDANEDGVLDLPDRSDLLPDAGRIGHFQVRGLRGVPNAFANSSLAAGSFGSVLLNTSSLANPVGLAGTPHAFGLVTNADGVDRLQLVLNRKVYSWQDHAWSRTINSLDLAVMDMA